MNIQEESATSTSFSGLDSSAQEQEIWDRLTSQFFKVESELQLISVLSTKISQRKKTGKEQGILCLAKKKGTLRNKSAEVVLYEGTFDNLKEKKKYQLKKLTKIEGGKDEKEIEFTLHIGVVKFHISCYNTDQKNIFLWNLIQISKETYNNIPELINLTHTELSIYATTDEITQSSDQIVSEIEDISNQNFISEEEEILMNKILERYNLDISESQHCITVLNTEVEKKDIENIHEILLKQEQWNGVIGQLTVAERQLNFMKGWLTKYNERLGKMRREIEQIESENNLMETQMRNFLDLENEILNLINRLEISNETEENLKKSFDDINGLKDILTSLEYLENGIDGIYENDMQLMILVQERKKVFEQKRFELVKRFKDFLKKLFFKLGDQIIKDKKPREELTLDKHDKTHEILFFKYKPLMKSSSIADKDGFKELKESYCQAMHIPYKKEITEYFNEIKIDLKKIKESKSHHFLLGDKNNYEIEHIIDSERIDFKFKNIILTLSDVLLNEQVFLSEFFHLKNEIEKEEMLIIIFKGLDSKLENLIDYFDKKLDRCYGLSMMTMIQKSNQSKYLNDLYDYLIKLLKEMFSKYLEKQIDSIKKYTCTIKHVNIVPYVSKYYLFVQKLNESLNNIVNKKKSDQSQNQSQNQFHQTQSQSQSQTQSQSQSQVLETEIYFDMIIKEIYSSIDKLAQTDLKHSNSFRMKNYYFLLQTIPDSRKTEIESSKKVYEQTKLDYIIWLIKSKFNELFTFIEGIDQFVSTTGFDIEDIGYQTQFSKQRLLMITSQYDTTFEIVKALLNIKKRMEKHLSVKQGENEICIKHNLFKICWTYLQQYFEETYQRFESNVLKCYHLSLSPSSKIIHDSFKQVEESEVSTKKNWLF
eukprot:gene5164-8770_t